MIKLSLLMPSLGLEPLRQRFMPRPGHRCQKTRLDNGVTGFIPTKFPVTKGKAKPEERVKVGEHRTKASGAVSSGPNQVGFGLCPPGVSSVPRGSWWGKHFRRIYNQLSEVRVRSICPNEEQFLFTAFVRFHQVSSPSSVGSHGLVWQAGSKAWHSML